MPKEGEICKNCGTKIRQLVIHEEALGGETHPAYGWTCEDKDCPAPVGDSDMAPPPDPA